MKHRVNYSIIGTRQRFFSTSSMKKMTMQKNVDRSVIIYTRQTKGVIVDKRQPTTNNTRRKEKKGEKIFLGIINQGNIGVFVLCWSNTTPCKRNTFLTRVKCIDRPTIKSAAAARRIKMSPWKIRCEHFFRVRQSCHLFSHHHHHHHSRDTANLFSEGN